MVKKQFPLLFSEGQMGSLRLKNRLVMAPMVTFLASDSGGVSEAIIRYYAERARGGVGLIITEGACVHPTGKSGACEMHLDKEDYVAGHSAMVDEVHNRGAKIAVQLHHGGRNTHPLILGMQPVAPSPVPHPGAKWTPRALTKDEIKEIIDAFAIAAWRAKRAGYDAVEVHGGHGYLPHEFLSPVTNHREDEYGGSLENRVRFTVEVLQRVRQRVGPAFPIILRLSPEGGYNYEEFLNFLPPLEAAGVDCFHVSNLRGVEGPVWPTHPKQNPMAVAEGYALPWAQGAKRLVKVPVIGVGEIRHPEFAEEALRQRMADFIALGRPLIADPYWINKVAEGRKGDIRPCLSCDFCYDRVYRGLRVHCRVNPAMGRERELGEIAPAPVKKTVMIAGAGPGGMEAAVVAARRGHRVNLFEREGQLGGGQLRIAAAAPGKAKILQLVDYYEAQLRKLKVAVHLNTSVNREQVGREAPDCLIVATGARPLVPTIPGVEKSNVLSAYDILVGRAKVLGKRVAVLGGKETGCETAEFLAERGCSVTVVSRGELAALGEDLIVSQRNSLLARLRDYGVQFIPGHDVREIRDGGLLLVNKEGKERFLEADAVVLARGAVSEAGLAEEVEELVPQVLVVGDAREPRDIGAAIYEGALAGLAVGTE